MYIYKFTSNRNHTCVLGISTGSLSNSPISQRGGKRKARSQSATLEATVDPPAGEPPRVICHLSASLLDGEEAQSADMAAAYLANNMVTDTKELLVDTEKSSDENLTEGEADETGEDGATDMDACHGADVVTPAATTSGSSNEAKEECKYQPIETAPVVTDPVQIAAASAPSQQPAFKDSVYTVYSIKPSKAKVGQSQTSAPDIAAADMDTDKSSWRVKLDEKIAVLKDGISRKVAEQLLIGDVCLLLGNLPRIQFVYDWLELSPMPDVLELGSRSNLLRRLLHVAAAEFTELQPREVVAPPQTVSQAVQVNILTTRDVASPRATAIGKRGGGGNNPSTPKQSGRGKNESGISSTTTIKLDTGSPIPCTCTPAAAEVKKTIVIAPALHPPSVPTGPRGDGVFKMPTKLPARILHPLAPKPNQSIEFDPVNIIVRFHVV